MDPLHATIEEFAAEGYTHIECFLPALPRHSTAANELASALSRWASRLTHSPDGYVVPCGVPFQSVKLWRQADSAWKNHKDDAAANQELRGGANLALSLLQNDSR